MGEEGLSQEYVLEMNGITKRYGENAVLKDVSLRVRPGEIHALLGENGAGKSTLMNILFGMPVIHATGGHEGSVTLDGHQTHITSPIHAMQEGIGMVHQEFMLIPGFTVAENIKLNREISRPNLVSRLLGGELETLDWQAMRADARKALSSVGMNLHEDTLVRGLPVGYMQFVEIAREIDKEGVKLLVFDEPTAVLTESEAEQLISVMKAIAARGIAVVFITHRLDEVMQAADTVTVLRDGRFVAEKPIGETSLVDMAAMMIGRGDEGQGTRQGRQIGPEAGVVLEARNLTVEMPGEMVRGIDMTVYQGEVLGVGGLAGQGKIGLPNGIMGLCPATGEVEVFGEPLPLGNAAQALARGLAFVSEDRRGVGLLLDQSIEDNIAFSAMQVHGGFLSGPRGLRFQNRREIRRYALDMIKRLDIRCTSPAQKVGTLSGGNQQKVCVARALALNPRLLFVSEPTRGIDIGAKKIVLETLTRLNREEGLTIVMISSELNELRSMCDRIAIISEGKVSDILLPQSSDVAFGLAMSGLKHKEEKTA